MQPIFLFADSQLLFQKNENGKYFSKQLLGDVINPATKCAYVGASNSDDPDYYQLFCEAMEIAGIRHYEMIHSDFDTKGQTFLQQADIVLLAGGDPEFGLQTFARTGMLEIFRAKLQQGATFIGVSAGAVQLGWEVFSKMDDDNYQVTEGMKFLPMIVLAHATPRQLDEAGALLKASPTVKRAYEIPAGGGMIYHPNLEVEAIRKPVNEFILRNDALQQTLILPVLL